MDAAGYKKGKRTRLYPARNKAHAQNAMLLWLSLGEADTFSYNGKAYTAKQVQNGLVFSTPAHELGITIE
jgi:hypothetical protein